MKERLVLWDIAKGICIILVVIGHYCPANAPDWYSLINRFIYSFHMPVFLFASGYIYMATQKDVSYIAFMRKKIKRLMIPYVSTSVIIVAIKLVSQNFFYMKNPVTGFTFLEILYKPAAGYFLWFIWVLWWAFLIIPFFKTTGQRLLLLAVSIAFYALPLDMGELFCLQEVKEMLLFFVMGVLSYELKDKLSRLSPFGIVLIFSFVLSEFFYLFYPHVIHDGVF